MTPPFFDESIPLRNEPVLTDPVGGAMEIQRYFDHIAWVTHSGDGTAHAPHIRKSPLAGNVAKPLLVQVQKGDQTAPNPRSTQFVRAGGNADITTFYLNDLAFAEDPTVNKNPHLFMTRYASPGLSGRTRPRASRADGDLPRVGRHVNPSVGAVQVLRGTHRHPAGELRVYSVAVPGSSSVSSARRPYSNGSAMMARPALGIVMDKAGAGQRSVDLLLQREVRLATTPRHP